MSAFRARFLSFVETGEWIWDNVVVASHVHVLIIIHIELGLVQGLFFEQSGCALGIECALLCDIQSIGSLLAHA